MVDIIKSFPLTATSFSSNKRHFQSKLFNQQLTLPFNLRSKRWNDNHSSFPTPLIDVSKSPYAIHRKVMYQQLSRHYPMTMDLNRSPQGKQRRTSKEATKTPTTMANEGANLTTQPTAKDGDVQSTRLFTTLSKHVTVKAEPLRPANGLINNPNNPSTSWQKYWTSTHTQRRRKEASEAEPTIYRPKREQTFSSQPHFVVLRDSPFSPFELPPQDTETSPPIDIDTDAKVSEITTTPDKPISSAKEDEMKKPPPPPPQISTIEFVASSLIPVCTEVNSNPMRSRMATMLSLKSTDKEDDKTLTDKSLLSLSTHFKNDSQLTDDVSDEQLDPRLITSKVYKLAIPEDQSKKSKKAPTRKIFHSKSTEKKDTRTVLKPSKQKRQVSISKRSMSRSELSTLMAATSISKNFERKWDEPYIGIRMDPPTPHCSPTLFVWLQDSDEDDDEVTMYEKSEIFGNNSADQVSKN